MSQISENNKRIAKNTLLLYFRMIFLLVISLFTSRVVLQTLGVEDYGIYNVVGGVVAMFSVFSGSLSVSISRFITYELGKGNQEKLKKLSASNYKIARERHNDEQIYASLISAYKQILNDR